MECSLSFLYCPSKKLIFFVESCLHQTMKNKVHEKLNITFSIFLSEKYIIQTCPILDERSRSVAIVVVHKDCYIYEMLAIVDHKMFEYCR